MVEFTQHADRKNKKGAVPMKCDFCGSEIDELEEICPICGAGKTQDDLQEAEYMEEDLEKQKSMDRNAKYDMEKPRNSAKARGWITGLFSVVLCLALMTGMLAGGTLYAARESLTEENALLMAEPAVNNQQIKQWLLDQINEESMPVFSLEEEDLDKLLEREDVMALIQEKLESAVQYLTTEQSFTLLTREEAQALLQDNQDIILQAAARKAGCEPDDPALITAVETETDRILSELEAQGFFAEHFVQNAEENSRYYIREGRILLSETSLFVIIGIVAAAAVLLLLLNWRRPWRGFLSCGIACFVSCAVFLIAGVGIDLYVGYVMAADAAQVIKPLTETFCAKSLNLALWCGVAGGGMMILYAVAKIVRGVILRSHREVSYA